MIHTRMMIRFGVTGTVTVMSNLGNGVTVDQRAGSADCDFRVHDFVVIRSRQLGREDSD